MKFDLKGYIFVFFSIALIVGGSFFVNTEYMGYALLCFSVALIFLLVGINSIITNSNPRRKYDSTVRDYLNTFDSILVKSTSCPKLENRNIIVVETMDDLVDAQLEIRKPICYLKQSDSCSFVLLDDKEAYVYIEKFDENVVSPVEIEIKEARIRHRSADEMDSEMLRDIEKTTIVKLSNKKSYKVSPVRKEKKEKKEEIAVEELDDSTQEVETLEEESNQQTVSQQIVETLDDIDVLDDTSSIEFLDDSIEIL